MWKMESKGKKRISQTLKSNGGTTLVELVVTFALLGLFAVGTSQMISSALKAYHQVRGLNYARQVSDTLMEKITGEIEGAQVSVSQGTEDNLDKTLKIYASGNVIELYDRTGSHIGIAASSKKSEIGNCETIKQYDTDQLLIYYYPVTTVTSDSSGNEITNIRYEAVDWVYDSTAYMGFEIESLKFSQADPAGIIYPKNIIKVDMDLKSGGYGSYKSVRYVECYNFATEQDFDKILDEGSAEPPNPPDPPDVPGDDHGFGGETQDDNEFVKALGEYFASGWTAREVTDKNGNAVTVYYKVTENNGKKYITIQRRDLDIDAGILDGLAEEVTGSNKFTLIDINGTKLSNTADGNKLILALGGDYNENYKQPVLYFDPENHHLMAVEYNYHSGSGQKDHWGYYEDYTAEDVENLK